MIFIDVNIFVDVLSGRKGAENSSEVIARIRSGSVKGAISALTVPILWFYLVNNGVTSASAKEDVRKITKDFTIVRLDENILNDAYSSEMKDFEDSIQEFSAIASKCDVIITRNKKDFKLQKDLKIMLPEEFFNSE